MLLFLCIAVMLECLISGELLPGLCVQMSKKQKQNLSTAFGIQYYRELLYIIPQGFPFLNTHNDLLKEGYI